MAHRPLAAADRLCDREPYLARSIRSRHRFDAGQLRSERPPPSNLELFDLLCVDFMERGWEAKRLHKVIMTLSVYQQSFRPTDNEACERASTVDRTNRLLWRMPLRRLEADALRDSVLAVSRRLDTSLDGPPVRLDARSDGLQVPVVGGATRYSVHLLTRRTWPATYMRTFDFPTVDTACTRSVPSATSLLSLVTMDSDFVFENAAAAARIV